jgi:hypothetical protein
MILYWMSNKKSALCSVNFAQINHFSIRPYERQAKAIFLSVSVTDSFQNLNDEIPSFLVVPVSQFSVFKPPNNKFPLKR